MAFSINLNDNKMKTANRYKLQDWPVVPELLFKNTGHPAFLIVENLTDEIFDDLDSVFTYSEATMMCYGRYEILSSSQFVPAHVTDGEDGEKTGFDPNEKISVGFYDKQTDKFYELHGTCKNMYNDKDVDFPHYAPMDYYHLTTYIKESGSIVKSEISYDIDTSGNITWSASPALPSGTQIIIRV